MAMVDESQQGGGVRGRVGMDERQLVEAGEGARDEQEAAEERTQRDLDGGVCPPGCGACDEMMI